VLAKTRVAAQPKAVLDVIRNTNAWSEWNSFCPRCVVSSSPGQDSNDRIEGLERGQKGWLELGTVANIEVFMSGEGLVAGKKKSRDQGIVITVLEAIEEEGRRGWRIAWKSTGWSHWQLHSERVMEFVEVDGGVTEYDCWETFGGLLGGAVKATVGTTLVDRFGDYARDVKEFVEGGKKVSDGSP
jgi:hypothetical protein